MNNEEYTIEERITNMLEEVLKDDSDSDHNNSDRGINKSSNRSSKNHPVIMLNNVVLADNIETEKNIILDKIQTTYKTLGLSPKMIQEKSPRGTLGLNNEVKQNEITQR
jgi:hypothetical protein